MKSTIVRTIVAIAACLTCFAASATTGKAPPSLDELLKQQPASPDGAGIPTIRFNAIRETAITFGAQAGLARRSYDNLQKLEKQAQKLDVVYNFQALMVEGNVVPPVLSETTDIYDQSAEDILRLIGKEFRILQQARFTYSPPTWRAYLMMGYSFDTNVVAAVAPQTDEERKLWKQGAEEGYALGVAQADSILKENYARLQRDFFGMVKYHQMLEAGMVTKPFVAAHTKDVVRSEDGAMHVGEVFLRITAAPDFVSEPGKWKTGPSGLAADRLRSAADPELAARMLRDAKAAGIVREKGR